MSRNVEYLYPKQRLLFFIAQDVNSAIRDSVKDLVEGLAKHGVWLIKPPVFVDASDYSGTCEEDLSDETVGVALEIYSAMNGSLPHDLDVTTLAEVECLVMAAQELSRSQALEIEFELDGVFVGAIEDGQLDKSLAEGLLGEWRRHLGV